jgi:zinc transport system substrate-binding protein
MKKWIHLTLIIAVVLTGCGQREKEMKKKLITVSILPEKYFVQRITGSQYDVNVLIPPGSSPESYDPSPRQLQDLENSVLYFRNGYFDFERPISEKIASFNKHIIFVDLSSGISLTGGQHNRSTSGDGAGIDPHFWLAPEEVSIMAGNILRALISLDPAGKERYTASCQEFLDELNRYDRKLDSLFASVRIRKFLVYHPALTYLARDYHLEQYAIEQEGKTPSPAYLIGIINMARKNNIRTIIIEKQFDTDIARTLAGEINGSLVMIDPLAYDWFKNMDAISSELAKALNP